MPNDFAPLVDVPKLADLRHRLHQIPELGYEEFKTAATIRAELDPLGIPHVDGVPDAPTATIASSATPRNRALPCGRDIDALPILEATGLPYASTHTGMMHACGHDGHTATLLWACRRALEGDGGPTRRRRPARLREAALAAGRGGRRRGERLVEAGVLDGRLGPKVRRHLRPARLARAEGRHGRHQAGHAAGRHRQLHRHLRRPRVPRRLPAPGHRSDRRPPARRC